MTNHHKNQAWAQQELDLHWQNDYALYWAVLRYAEELLSGLPTMTDQTLGLNVRNALGAAANDGGWGWRSCPDLFTGVAPAVRANLRDSLRDCWHLIREDELAASVRESMEIEEVGPYRDLG